MARRVREPKGDNTIYGTNGDDELSGIGGSFTLIGGKGNDTYIVDDTGDKVSEKNRSGTDLVKSSINYTLGSHVENLTLVGEYNLSGTGNDSDNIIIGNIGDNTLQGLGGDDTLDGGAGNDLIDGGDGTDTAIFAGSYSDYTFERVGTDLHVTYGLTGEIDILRNIELLSFGDSTEIAETSINGGTAEPPTSQDPPAPQAVDDTVEVNEDSTISFDVLVNDSEGLSVESVNNGNSGTTTFNTNGIVTYTPNANFNGQDSFEYTVIDSLGRTATASVTVTVTASATDRATVPYYVEGLLFGDTFRTNYPDSIGTSDVITFAFLDEVPAYYSSDSFVHDRFQTFSAQQRQATLDALAMIAGYANVTFIETDIQDAEMTFGLADLPGALGVGSLPSSDGVWNESSDVWIDVDWARDSFISGTNPYQTLLHEIGHALGFDHPLLPADENNRQHTVMSSLSHPTMDSDVDAYLLYDIAVLQYIYGANTSYATGNDVYDFSAFDGVITTIWDAGGHDVIDMSGATYAVDLDLAAGAFSTIAATGSNNLAIAFGTVIEDAIGSSYNDIIAGNDAANRLSGGDGDDVLTGRGGTDTFVFAGKWGNDTITDFVRGEDQLDFTEAGLGYANLAITSSGGDTLINYHGDSVTLQGVATIDENDFFVFVA